MGRIIFEESSARFISPDEIAINIRVLNDTSEENGYTIWVYQEEDGLSTAFEPFIDKSIQPGEEDTIVLNSDGEAWDINSLKDWFKVELTEDAGFFGVQRVVDTIYGNAHTQQLYLTRDEAIASVTPEQEQINPSQSACDIWCKVLYYGKKVAIYGGIAIGALIILSAIVKSGRNGGN